MSPRGATSELPSIAGRQALLAIKSFALELHAGGLAHSHLFKWTSYH
jgi:hypothetical protein